jgi:hypothetical protein
MYALKICVMELVVLMSRSSNKHTKSTMHTARLRSQHGGDWAVFLDVPLSEAKRGFPLRAPKADAMSTEILSHALRIRPSAEFLV